MIMMMIMMTIMIVMNSVSCKMIICI